jgi:hypothetical protein
LLHPRLRLCEQIIKPCAPAERTRPGTRAYSQAVLRQITSMGAAP